MPINASDLDTIGKTLWVRLPHSATRSPKITVNDDPPNDVQGVQRGERKIDRQKCVRLGVQVMLEFSGVLKRFNDQERQSQKDRYAEIKLELAEFVLLKRRPGNDHTHA